MANKWNIPTLLEQEIRSRDRVCVYCGTPFKASNVSRRHVASWEHILNDEAIVTAQNIALCRVGCNASKGTKKLSVWLQSRYCEEHGITKDSIARVVQNAIANGQ
jgi:hypothetical protein